MAVIVITGTSTGIGLATALMLARAGHTVYGTMRRPDRATELADTAASENLPVTVLPLDVVDEASVKNAFARVYEEQGRIDVLVNNAGVSTVGPIEDLDLSAFRNDMETNYFGVVRCIKEVLPRMREQRDGCIINISSVAGRVATAPQGPYAASKFALEAMTEILAQEVKPFNVRVAIVEPGIIATPILEKSNAPLPPSPYFHERRLRATFVAATQNPTSADVVAKKISDIIENGTWVLRHPVGRDARPLIAWRKMMTDEEWIERNAEPDEDVWLAKIKSESGVDMRPFLQG